MNGIRPKVVLKGKQHDEHARRYLWYPLSNLDFAGSQWISPIWNPKFPRGRFVLVESFEYQSQVVDETAGINGANGVSLGERTMGTDAQVRALMGNTEGTGWMDKGMTNLDSLIDVDPDTALEIEEMIIPNGKVPDTLIEFRDLLNNVQFSQESPVVDLAKKALEEMKSGIYRAINFCNTYTSQLEQELQQGQAGGLGIKSLNETNKYYFRQIQRPLPEDRVGTNMGTEMSKTLAPLLAALQTGQPTTNTLESTIELEELKNKLAAIEATAKEQEEVIEALTKDNDKTRESKAD